MRRFLSFMSFVILLATVPSVIKGDTCFTCGRQEIAVPSYVYPCSGTAGCAWDVFKTGASTVIINPSSGPGTAANSDYVNLVTSVKNNSTVTTVLGYVRTTYGNRNTSQVLSDIDAYFQFYPMIDGIFLDEGSTSCDTTNVTNYKSYDARVKSKGRLGFTVLNWGTVGSECYLINTKIDTYVTFEGKIVREHYMTALRHLQINDQLDTYM